MTIESTTKSTFHVIGIKVETSNEKAILDIPQLWNQFFSENTQNQIPNKKCNDVFAIYTDYEGDYTQPYSYILGCSVSSLEVIPVGMVGMSIPSNNYDIYTAKGKIPDVVAETWQIIWKEDNDSKRAYQTDFEIYSQEYGDLEVSEVKIYIGIK